MAYQSIGLGSAADDGTGDSLRAGGTKLNANFSEIYTLLGTGTALCTGITAGADDFTLVGASYDVTWDKSMNMLGFEDNAKLMLGTSNDLQIWHDGSSTSTIQAAIGNLYIQSTGTNSIVMQAKSGENSLICAGDAGVTLYYDHSVKLATTSSGISVTGTVVTSGNIELGAGATLIFEGSSADAHETVLTVADPTADRTITLPNSTGTLITTGDTGVITATMIADGAITANDLANGSITSAKIADATITGADIAADTVAESNMADDAISSVQLKSLQTLLIKNSSGSTLRTLHCAGA